VRPPCWQPCSDLRMIDGVDLSPQSEEEKNMEVKDYASKADYLSSDNNTN
jgi:hypothetical protein